MELALVHVDLAAAAAAAAVAAAAAAAAWLGAAAPVVGTRETDSTTCTAQLSAGSEIYR